MTTLLKNAGAHIRKLPTGIGAGARGDEKKGNCPPSHCGCGGLAPDTARRR